MEKKIAILLSLFLLQGCSTTDSGQLEQNSQSLAIDAHDWLSNSSLEPVRYQKNPTHSISKIIANDRIGHWVRHFSVHYKSMFNGFLERGDKLKPMILKKLKNAGLPEELYYLGLIESGYRLKALSHAGAAGIWQFIPETARRYGLIVSKGVDERLHPEKATDAAIHYLTDLFNVFQSWPLAAAAYNAGEGRVLRSIMKSNTRDYWRMVAKGSLPRETSNYVGMWFAATVIGKNIRKFGIYREASPDNIYFTGIPVKRSVHLQDIADQCQMHIRTIQSQNPHLLSQTILPPKNVTIDLRVTSDQKQRCLASNKSDKYFL